MCRGDSCCHLPLAKLIRRPSSLTLTLTLALSFSLLHTHTHTHTHTALLGAFLARVLVHFCLLTPRNISPALLFYCHAVLLPVLSYSLLFCSRANRLTRLRLNTYLRGTFSLSLSVSWRLPFFTLCSPPPLRRRASSSQHQQVHQ